MDGATGYYTGPDGQQNTPTSVAAAWNPATGRTFSVDERKLTRHDDPTQRIVANDCNLD